VTETRPGIDPFNSDAAGGEGYIYTTTKQLSSRLATARQQDLILEMGRFEGRSVVDIGCGDGFYTIGYWDRGRPRSLAGVDAAPNAIEVANRNRGARPLDFKVGDFHELSYPDSSFEIAILQGVLHHDDDPLRTIKEALRVAADVVVLEPNGLSPGAKVIEKVSAYHREHHERSYSRGRLRSWFEQAGGKVVAERYGIFVPMFCPDWMARPMKALEPAVEATPGLRMLGCSAYVARVTH
jgi:ubiquinone/menaquinone biosynthesis C-methylase UbiE